MSLPRNDTEFTLSSLFEKLSNAKFMSPCNGMLVSKQTETFEHASANESSELQTLAL